MSVEKIKELIQSTLQESGYMYTLGMLKGMFVARVFSAEEWVLHVAYLNDLNMEILRWNRTNTEI